MIAIPCTLATVRYVPSSIRLHLGVYIEGYEFEFAYDHSMSAMLIAKRCSHTGGEVFELNLLPGPSYAYKQGNIVDMVQKFLSRFVIVVKQVDDHVVDENGFPRRGNSSEYRTKHKFIQSLFGMKVLV